MTKNPFEDYTSILDNFDKFCDEFESRAAEAFMRGDQNNGKVVRAATDKLGGETPGAVTEIRELGVESVGTGETDFSLQTPNGESV